MKISILKVIATLAVFVGFAGFVNAQVKDETPKRISVKSLVASGIPVNTEFVTVTKLEDNSVLTYSITNKDSQKLDAVDILLVVYGANGKAKGGESWRQRVDLTKDASADLSRLMKTKVTPGDRVVFSIYEAEGQTGQWGVETTKIVEVAKAFIAGNRYSLPEARFTKTK